MSSVNVYSLDGFSMYLMPKTAAPECPPCQSDILPSVFEDDDECELDTPVSGVLSKINKVLQKDLGAIKTLCPHPIIFS